MCSSRCSSLLSLPCPCACACGWQVELRTESQTTTDQESEPFWLKQDICTWIALKILQTNLRLPPGLAEVGEWTRRQELFDPLLRRWHRQRRYFMPALRLRTSLHSVEIQLVLRCPLFADRRLLPICTTYACSDKHIRPLYVLVPCRFETAS